MAFIMRPFRMHVNVFLEVILYFVVYLTINVIRMS